MGRLIPPFDRVSILGIGIERSWRHCRNRRRPSLPTDTQ